MSLEFGRPDRTPRKKVGLRLIIARSASRLWPSKVTLETSDVPRASRIFSLFRMHRRLGRNTIRKDLRGYYFIPLRVNS